MPFWQTGILKPLHLLLNVGYAIIYVNGILFFTLAMWLICQDGQISVTCMEGGEGGGRYVCLTWQCIYTPNYLWPTIITRHGVVGHNTHIPRVLANFFICWSSCTSKSNVTFGVTYNLEYAMRYPCTIYSYSFNKYQISCLNIIEH